MPSCSSLLTPSARDLFPNHRDPWTARRGEWRSTLGGTPFGPRVSPILLRSPFRTRRAWKRGLPARFPHRLKRAGSPRSQESRNSRAGPCSALHVKAMTQQGSWITPSKTQSPPRQKPPPLCFHRHSRFVPSNTSREVESRGLKSDKPSASYRLTSRFGFTTPRLFDSSTSRLFIFIDILALFRQFWSAVAAATAFPCQHRPGNTRTKSPAPRKRAAGSWVAVLCSRLLVIWPASPCGSEALDRLRKLCCFCSFYRQICANLHAKRA